jgi:polyphosphate kinase
MYSHNESRQSLMNHYLLHCNAPRGESECPTAHAEPNFDKDFLAWCVSNRDLSQIEFFRRLIEEAADDSVPPLERLKFLSVFASNLDEFFMVRVSGLKEIAAHADEAPTPGELPPAEQLRVIRKRLLPMLRTGRRVLRKQVLPALAESGIHITDYDSLTRHEQRTLDEYFTKHVFGLLTPRATDAAHPFPFIPNLCLNLALTVAPVPEHGITQSLTGNGKERFALVEIPNTLPRLIPVEGEARRFVLIEDLISANIQAMFPRMRTGACHTFRVTRDADVSIRQDKAADLLQTVRKSLRERRFGMPVRLEVSATMSNEMVEELTEHLGLSEEDVYTTRGVINVIELMNLYDLEAPELKDAPMTTTVPAALLTKESVFDQIKRGDILLHHPYTAYSTVTDFIRAAADDPDVVAIKMCLYRTGQNSPIARSLIEASARGKQVTALVEIKARFDEARNIECADQLAEAGVHVIHGVMNLKTHCKVALVVRREAEGLQTYVHIATGNYNPTTSKIYTDLGLLTANPEIGEDATDLFNYLTGFSRQKDYTRLLVAPVNLRERMLSMIEREMQHARAGRPARIIAKTNRLTDLRIIAALYEASQAGVEIDLIVRGACMLRPGIAGLSETIRVRSIVGRLLEHSRIFFFENGGDEEIYIGSADWMRRNLDRRVEVATPILDPQLRTHLKDAVLGEYLRDNVKARELTPDGSYKPVRVAPGERRFDSQLHFSGDTRRCS